MARSAPRDRGRKIEGESLIWKRDARVWRFDSQRVTRTQRALETLEKRRGLSLEERARLENRCEKLRFLAPLAQIERLENATLRQRFLLATQLEKAPPERFCGARAVVRSSSYAAILRELSLQKQTREFAEWVEQNAADLRELRGEWPLNLAATLGWNVWQLRHFWGENSAPNQFHLSENSVRTALKKGVGAATIREILEIWNRWEWVWPSFECVEPHFAGRSKIGKHRAKWRGFEAKARCEWFDLWQKIAQNEPEALPLALEFHEFWLAQGRLTVSLAHTPSDLGSSLFKSLKKANARIFDSLSDLAKTPFAARGLRAVLDWAGEFAARNGSSYVSLSREEWGQILRLASHCDAATLRELWREEALGGAVRLSDKPHYLALWRQWHRGLGETDLQLFYLLSNLPYSARRAMFLRERTAQALAPCREASTEFRAKWLRVLIENDKALWNVGAWENACALLPLVLQKRAAEDLKKRFDFSTCAVDWAHSGAIFGFETGEVKALFARYLRVLECHFDFLDKAQRVKFSYTRGALSL